MPCFLYFVLLPSLAHGILMQCFFRLPYSSHQFRHNDPFPHTHHSTSSSLTFKPCLLQTTRKDFAEHQLKDTYCATNKEGLNTIKILTCTLKCHEILNQGSALHLRSTIAPKDCQHCRKITGCLQQLEHTGTLDCHSFLLRLLMAFMGAWSP